MFEPIIVYPFVYTLKLESGKYYVGITNNFNMRYSQHINGTGAVWTRMYKPIKILAVCIGDINKENEITLDMMKKHGFENVRGGNWCKVELKSNPLDKILDNSIDA